MPGGSVVFDNTFQATNPPISSAMRMKIQVRRESPRNPELPVVAIARFLPATEARRVGSAYPWREACEYQDMPRKGASRVTRLGPVVCDRAPARRESAEMTGGGGLHFSALVTPTGLEPVFSP